MSKEKILIPVQPGVKPVGEMRPSGHLVSLPMKKEVFCKIKFCLLRLTKLTRNTAKQTQSAIGINYHTVLLNSEIYPYDFLIKSGIITLPMSVSNYLHSKPLDNGEQVGDCR